MNVYFMVDKSTLHVCKYLKSHNIWAPLKIGLIKIYILVVLIWVGTRPTPYPLITNPYNPLEAFTNPKIIGFGFCSLDVNSGWN